MKHLDPSDDDTITEGQRIEILGRTGADPSDDFDAAYGIALGVALGAITFALTGLVLYVIFR